MRYALYPGCTVLGRGRNYEMSARAVAHALGIEIVDLDAFECCGFPIKSVHYETFLLMSARNLLAAEDNGLDICTLCSACTSSLTEVNKHLTEHFDEKTRILARLKKQGINYRLDKNIIVKHFTKILYEDIGTKEIEKQIKKNLSNLKIAPHYGCHYLKPTDIYDNPEDPENPYSLDELIKITGAQSVNYAEKTRCCGAAVLAISEDLAYALARPKLKELTTPPHLSPVIPLTDSGLTASTGQALPHKERLSENSSSLMGEDKGGGEVLSNNSCDAMVLMCPFCSVIFDDNQRKIEQKFQEVYNLPILYYPQLLGLALGIDEKTLGLRMNRVSTKILLEKIK